MPSRRHLLLCGLAVVGCGARSELGIFEQAQGEVGGAPMTSGGSASRGGTMTAAGRAMGGAAGPAIGASGRAGSVSEGGALGGSPAAGEAGVGVGGAAAGEPSGGAAGAAGSGGEASAALAVDLGLAAFHSCAGFDDGSLRCWGTGGYIGSGSKLTIGDDEAPDTIAAVQIGGRVTQLSAGWYHTCALLEAGNVRCFGDGFSGLLGYGNTNDVGDDEPPVSAGDVSLGGRVLQVSAGPFHTCAVLDTAQVRCWGSNQLRLGRADPDSVGDDELPTSVDVVDVGGFVQQVAAGYTHTCVLLDTGNVRCWGQNLYGELGYGNLEPIGDNESPAAAGDVDVGGTVVQIVAGTSRTCALLDSGKVRCWGKGQDGGLGYGNRQSIGDDESPASAGDIDVGGPVKMLAAGDHATCALLVGGSVRCWGSGTLGELGYGNTEDIGDDETPASVGDVDVGGTVTRIDVGYVHACATLENGAVRCWGRAATGALGYGNTHDIGDDEAPAAAGDVKLW